MDEAEERQRLINYRTEMYKIVIPIFIVISCLGVLANAIVVFALRATKVTNATVTLILSLTISDIWTSSIVAFSLLYNSYLPTVQDTKVNPCFSLTLEMMRTGGLITGIFHLLLIAVHHYIGIVRPYTSKTVLKKLAQFLCTLTWLTPTITLFGLALAFPNQGYWNCEDVRFYYTRAFRTTISGLLTLIFVIILSTYFRLLRILHLQREKWKRQKLYSVATSTTAMLTVTATSSKNKTNLARGDDEKNLVFNSASTTNQHINEHSNPLIIEDNEIKKGANFRNAVTNNNAAIERRAARENRTLWTTILICSSFFLGWAPATILFTLTCDTCTILSGNQRFLFYFSCTQLCFILAKSLVNPLIYSLRIPEVDSEINSVFQRCLQVIRRYFNCVQSSKKTVFDKITNQYENRKHRVLDSPTESMIDRESIIMSCIANRAQSEAKAKSLEPKA